jgi:hypothetical protein
MDARKMSPNSTKYFPSQFNRSSLLLYFSVGPDGIRRASVSIGLSPDAGTKQTHLPELVHEQSQFVPTRSMNKTVRANLNYWSQKSSPGHPPPSHPAGRHPKLRN